MGCGAKPRILRKGTNMKVFIGCDHAALGMKNEIVEYVKSLGFEAHDEGTYTEERVDYPVYAKKVALAVKENEGSLGILICGTGIGMSLAANKVKGIRAAAVSEVYSAKLTRQHNNSNIVCIGARVIGVETAKMIVDAFLNTEFEGERHQRRVDMIAEIENEQ